MNRIIGFIHHHALSLALGLSLLIFFWMFLFLFQAVRAVASPAASTTEIVESPIAPLNTRTFKELQEALERESSAERQNWSTLRDPFAAS